MKTAYYTETRRVGGGGSIKVVFGMVATGQEMVRENKNSSTSGKSQGISFWVRENWHFEEKSAKIEIVRLI